MTRLTNSPVIQGDLLGEAEIISERSASRRQLFIYSLVIVCATVFVVHLPALCAQATFHDDQMYLKENLLVQNPSWASVRRFFAEVFRPSTVKGYYQPLTMISLMTDVAITGRSNSMRAFHRTSLLLHVANTGLVAVVLYLLFGHTLVAGGVALLFGLHPMTVDSICWLSERKTVLATFFGLLSLICYVRFAQSHQKRHYIGCVLTYVLALLAKPITVPLPAVMMLMDYWPLDRIRWRTVLEKVPLFFVGIVFAVITFVSQSRTSPVILPGQYNPVHIPLILCHNIVFYLYKIVWPVRLSAHYEDAAPTMMLAGVVGTSLLIPMLIVSLRWTRGLLTGWLIFFIAILPAMGIISVTPVIAANRYAYLPSIGLLIALAALLAWFLGNPSVSKAPVRQTIVFAVLVVVIGAETIATRKYLRSWRDSISLCEHMLRVTPKSAALHTDIGVAFAKQGKSEEAVNHYQWALRIAPRFALAHFNLAVELGKTEEKADRAIKHYRRALETNPLFLEAHLNLGDILESKGELDEAVSHFYKAVQINPKYVNGHYRLGKALAIGENPPEGLEHLREALRLNPNFLVARRELAWLLATHPDPSVRDGDDALRLAEQASDQTGNRNPAILDTLAAAYAARGQFSLAAAMAERAMMLASHTQNDELASQISERLQLYEEQTPYTEDPTEQKKLPLAKVSRDELKSGNENPTEVPQ